MKRLSVLKRHYSRAHKRYSGGDCSCYNDRKAKFHRHSMRIEKIATRILT